MDLAVRAHDVTAHVVAPTSLGERCAAIAAARVRQRGGAPRGERLPEERRKAGAAAAASPLAEVCGRVERCHRGVAVLR